MSKRRYLQWKQDKEEWIKINGVGLGSDDEEKLLSQNELGLEEEENSGKTKKMGIY